MILRIRATTPSDAEACGRIIYEAFKEIADRHGFPPDFPDTEVATELAKALIANPSVFGIVAEEDGRVVGSNFLKEGDAIRAVGPITVDPWAQGSGVGRRLMQEVLARANGATGVRAVPVVLARHRGIELGEDTSRVRPVDPNVPIVMRLEECASSAGVADRPPWCRMRHRGRKENPPSRRGRKQGSRAPRVRASRLPVAFERVLGEAMDVHGADR